MLGTSYPGQVYPGQGYPPGLSAYAREILADAPLAWWRMDEASGSSFADSSGNGHALAITGTPTFRGAAPGNGLATSVAFTGSQYANLAAPTWFTAGSAWSLECWVKTSTASMQAGLISRDDTGTAAPNAVRMIELELSSGKAALEVFNASTSNFVLAPTTMTDGVWRHLAMTYNGTTATLYVNGVSTGTPASLAGPLTAGTGAPLMIGATYNSGSIIRNLIGSMAEPAVYGTALSGARILAHYTAGVGGSTVNGTAAAPLGALAVAATGTRTRPATGTVPLGALTIAATGTRTHFTTATAPLGTLTVTATSHNTINGTAAAPLGALVVTSRAAIVGRGTVTLGSLTIASTGFRSRPGTAALPLGALAVASSGTVRRAGISSVALGSLTVASVGGVVHVVSGTAAVLLGSVAVNASGYILHLPPQSASVLSDGTTAVSVTAEQGGITYTSVVTSGSTAVLVQPQGRQLGQVLVDGRTDVTITRNAGQRVSVLSSGVTRVLLIYKPAPDGPVLSADISNNTPIGVGVDLTGFYVCSEGA